MMKLEGVAATYLSDLEDYISDLKQENSLLKARIAMLEEICEDKRKRIEAARKLVERL